MLSPRSPFPISATSKLTQTASQDCISASQSQKFSELLNNSSVLLPPPPLAFCCQGCTEFLFREELLKRKIKNCPVPHQEKHKVHTVDFKRRFCAACSFQFFIRTKALARTFSFKLNQFHCRIICCDDWAAFINQGHTQFLLSS